MALWIPFSPVTLISDFWLPEQHGHRVYDSLLQQLGEVTIPTHQFTTVPSGPKPAPDTQQIFDKYVLNY